MPSIPILAAVAAASKAATSTAATNAAHQLFQQQSQAQQATQQQQLIGGLGIAAVTSQQQQQQQVPIDPAPRSTAALTVKSEGVDATSNATSTALTSSVFASFLQVRKKRGEKFL
jgi:hypothetical protein